MNLSTSAPITMNNTSLVFVPLLHQHMMKHRFLLAWRGPFSHSISLAMLTMSENRLVQDGVEVSTRKKIFNIMMDTLENVTTHSGKPNAKGAAAIVMLGRNEDDYFIYSGTTIATAEVPRIKEQLSRISELNSDELRNLYTELLHRLTIDEVIDSEVNWINIARKSGQSIAVDFSPVDELTSFFAMKTTIATART